MLHQIGAGTLGPVFRAYDPEQDRLVAVKLFNLNLPPERVHQFVSRLQQFIDLDLAHPALAAPLLAGIVDASPFLAQDFVAADSLDILVREFGSTPAADAARVATQLAAALDFAAAVGVFHGGLHPRDVLLASDDARLTGLGISQALEAVGVVAPPRRPYAAPERVSGGAWDRRADVYGLAVLIAEMMTGHRPAHSGALDSGRFGAAGAREALRAVFARAMAERPADRFETAQAFADALKQVVEDDTTSATASLGDVTAASNRGAAVPPLTLTLPLDPPVVRRLPIDEPLRGAMPERLPGDAPPAAVDDAADLAYGDVLGASAERADDWELRPVDGHTQIDTPTRIDAAGQASLIDVVVGVRPVEPAQPVSEPPVRPAGPAAPPTAVPLPPPVAGTPALSSVWPIPVALLVGMIVGIAIGFFVFANRPAEPVEVLAGSPAGTPAAAVAPVVSAPPSAPNPAPVVALPVVAPPVANVAAAPTENPAPGVESRAADAGPLLAAPPGREPPQRDPPPSPARRAEPPARPATPVGRVLVRTSPAGARVWLDGRDVGTTPLTLRTVPLGTHALRLTRDGYSADERRVTLSASQPAQSVVVDLERPRSAAGVAAGASARFPAALTVESRPQGATVFLDGRRIGTTPLTVSSIESGSHVVRLELDGYRLWSSAVRVASGERNRVAASLEH